MGGGTFNTHGTDDKCVEIHSEKITGRLRHREHYINGYKHINRECMDPIYLVLDRDLWLDLVNVEINPFIP